MIILCFYNKLISLSYNVINLVSGGGTCSGCELALIQAGITMAENIWFDKMALLCWRHGEGVLLHVLCSFIMFPFNVWYRWIRCTDLLEMTTHASSCMMRACGVNWRGIEALALAWMFLAGPVIQCMAEDPINNSGLKTYSCSELLGLQGGGALPSPGLLQDVPDELCRHLGGKYR